MKLYELYVRFLVWLGAAPPTNEQVVINSSTTQPQSSTLIRKDKEDRAKGESLSKKIDFDTIFDTAWLFITQYKFLYLLGFITIVGSNSVGGSQLLQLFQQYLFQQYERNLYILEPAFILPDVPAIQWLSYFDNTASTLYLGILVLIVLWITHFIANAGLISTVIKLNYNESFSFLNILGTSIQKGGRLLLLNLLLFGLFYVIILLVIAETLTDSTRLFSQILTTSCVSCILIPLIFVAWGIYPFAMRSMIYYDHSPVASIRHSFNLILHNLSRLASTFLLVFFIILILGPAFQGFALLINSILEFFSISIELLAWPIIISIYLITVFLSTYISIIITLLFLDCNQYLTLDKQIKRSEISKSI